ncbi:MAG: hypothetical protein EOO43_00580 [Flavobacterium sp.]|nr:MAG: hypothetical protein EOO43_00580 [Flavobacterium sp.]
MLESLIKKLGIIVSKKSYKNTSRKHQVYSIDEDAVARYDKLISIMNPQNEILHDYPEEEE